MEISVLKRGGQTVGKGPTEMAKEDLAAHVRRLRQSRGWTLEQASEITGLSRSGLSKIERAEMSPTFTALQKLANGFGIGLEELLSNEEKSLSQPSGRRSIMRADSGQVYELPNYRMEFFLNDLKNTAFTPYIAVAKKRALGEIGEFDRHNSQDFVFVLKGHVVMHTEFYEPAELGPGDSVYFDASMGHAFLSKGEEDAEMLCISAMTKR